MFNSFSISVKNLRNKIKLDEEKLFYNPENGFYSNTTKRRKTEVTKTITIYFETEFEKNIFETHFKVNKAVVENISGKETAKLMQLLFLLEHEIVVFTDSKNTIVVNGESVRTRAFFEKIKEEKENERFF